MDPTNTELSIQEIALLHASRRAGLKTDIASDAVRLSGNRRFDLPIALHTIDTLVRQRYIYTEGDGLYELTNKGRKAISEWSKTVDSFLSALRYT